jgi:hypothetical protein
VEGSSLLADDARSKGQRRTAGGTSGINATVLPLTARAKFCHTDMVATINTLGNHHKYTHSPLSSTEPVLLELQRLRYNPANTTSSSSSHQPDLFRLQTVAQSCNSVTSSTLPNSMISSTCLDVASYDASSGPVPVATGLSTGALCIHTAASISDFCLYPYKTQDNDDKLEDWMSSLYSRRAVVVHNDRSVCDVAKHRFAPLAISRRDGRLLHGFGRTVWIGPTGEGPAAMESLKSQPHEDVSRHYFTIARGRSLSLF